MRMPLKDLTLEQLLETPVWIAGLVRGARGPNNGTVRTGTPNALARANDVVVRTIFRLADGSVERGYCRPAFGPVPPGPPVPEFAALAPAILMPAGRVPFWFATYEKLVPETLLAILGRSADEVFPVHF